MGRYTPTERIGVNAVESVTLNDLGWIFREQMIVDMGIDAHLELVEDGVPTGKLVAVQIKTGLGNFHVSESHLTYYIEKAHRDYWLNHALPVILVAHLPGTDETLWAPINDSNVEETPSKWKVSIARGSVYGSTSKLKLAELFEGSESQQKFRRLVIDEPLMRHIAAGGKVSVELEHWVNKSLGRTPVTVFVSEDSEEPHIEQDYFITYRGYDTQGLAESIFPWASISVDEEFYDLNAEDDDDDWHRYGWHEEGYFQPPIDRGVYPYKNVAGEVDCYRLQFSLNEISKAYLVLADYLSSD